MSDHPNAVTVLRSFEAWNSGDLDVIRGYFTEDAVLHFAGNNAMSGTYRGRDAVMDALGRAMQGWGPHTEMEAILASDVHVIDDPAQARHLTPLPASPADARNGHGHLAAQ